MHKNLKLRCHPQQCAAGRLDLNRPASKIAQLIPDGSLEIEQRECSGDCHEYAEEDQAILPSPVAHFIYASSKLYQCGLACHHRGWDAQPARGLLFCNEHWREE